MSYVIKTFLLVSSSVPSKQLLCFVHGEGQQSEQKHATKNFVGFHNHSPLLTMDKPRRRTKENNIWYSSLIQGIQPISQNKKTIKRAVLTSSDKIILWHTVCGFLLSIWVSTVYNCQLIRIASSLIVFVFDLTSVIEWNEGLLERVDVVTWLESGDVGVDCPNTRLLSSFFVFLVKFRVFCFRIK